MAIIAKNIGNTGSTGANRLVFDFQGPDAGSTLRLAGAGAESGFSPADLIAASAHQYGQAPGFNGIFVLTRIKTIIVYGPENATIDTRIFQAGAQYDFSDIGGLPLFTPITNAPLTGLFLTGFTNSITAATTSNNGGVVVEFRA